MGGLVLGEGSKFPEKYREVWHLEMGFSVVEQGALENPDKNWKHECPKAPNNLVGKDTRFKSHPIELDRINDNQTKELG